MTSDPRGVRSSSRSSRSIIRDVDKALPSTSSANDKNKSTKNESNDKNKSSKNESVDKNKSSKNESNDKNKSSKNESNDKKNKDSEGTKKTAKAIKAEEKLQISHDETTKKGDKKKDSISSNTSRTKLSVKWDPDIVETKDSVKNSKIKKETKETLKKELDSDTLKDDQIVEDKKVGKKKYTRNLFGKSAQKKPPSKIEKVAKVKPTETGLPGMRKMRAIKEQIKTFVKVITPFKKSKRGAANTQKDILNKGKPDDEAPKVI